MAYSLLIAPVMYMNQQHTMSNTTTLPFVFFGTDVFSIGVLDALEKAGFLPTLIVTAPPRRQGRGMELTEPPVNEWADKYNIPTLQPEKLDNAFIEKLQENSPKEGWPVFLLASYGIIIPTEVLDIPERGVLNVHPSLLPKYRGASPIQSQILDGEKDIGVTIMLMDEKMDHGPIVASEKLEIESDVLNAEQLSEKLASTGGELLHEIVSQWVAGKIEATPQDHENATFTKKITKADGEIDISDDGITNYRKFLAYTSWPGCYFFQEGKRIKITEASFEDEMFILKKVIPEGKKETDWEMFVKNNKM